jgi:hypothetical protein
MRRRCHVNCSWTAERISTVFSDVVNSFKQLSTGPELQRSHVLLPVSAGDKDKGLRAPLEYPGEWRQQRTKVPKA